MEGKKPTFKHNQSNKDYKTGKLEDVSGDVSYSHAQQVTHLRRIVFNVNGDVS